MIRHFVNMVILSYTVAYVDFFDKEISIQCILTYLLSINIINYNEILNLNKIANTDLIYFRILPSVRADCMYNINKMTFYVTVL